AEAPRCPSRSQCRGDLTRVAKLGGERRLLYVPRLGEPPPRLGAGAPCGELRLVIGPAFAGYRAAWVERPKARIYLSAHDLISWSITVDEARLETIKEVLPETGHDQRGDADLSAMQADPPAVTCRRHVDEMADEVFHARQRRRCPGCPHGEAGCSEEPRKQGEGGLFARLQAWRGGEKRIALRPETGEGLTII